MEMSMEGAVFVQTNAAHNEVIAFSRAADGIAHARGDVRDRRRGRRRRRTCRRRARSR